MCMAAVGLLGAVVSGLGAAQAMNTKAAGYDAQAQILDRQSDIERMKGSFAAQQRERKVASVLGAQRAGYGAAGIALSGTPGDVIGESAEEGAMDVAAIRWNSGLAATNKEYDAKVARMNSESASDAAPMAFLAPVLSGVAKFGGSFGDDLGAAFGG